MFTDTDRKGTFSINKSGDICPIERLSTNSVLPDWFEEARIALSFHTVVLRPLLTSNMSFVIIAYSHTSRLVYHEEHLRSPTVTRVPVYVYRDATTHYRALVWLDSPCTRGISHSMCHKLAFTLNTATFTLHVIPRGIDTAISLRAAPARLDLHQLGTRIAWRPEYKTRERI